MILDSNVLIDLIDADKGEESLSSLASLREGHELFANEIIFAEVSSGFFERRDLSLFFDRLGVAIVRLTLDECYRAGRAFAEYRRRGGSREAILPDFLIGAQAEMRHWPIVTRDRKGFASYFPKLEIIDPMEH